VGVQVPRDLAGTEPLTEERSPRHAPPQLRGMRAAFVFLTRIPVGGFPYRGEDWVWAAAHAPFVGLVVGALLGGLDRLLLPLGPFPSAILVIGASLLVTGAFHEDGLADTCDALGGGHEPGRVLAILKDSRIGSFGSAALVVSIAARAALLAQLGPAGLWALPIVGCAARVGPIWLLARLPYVTATSEAKSRAVAHAGTLQAIVASAWLLAAAGAAITAGWTTAIRMSGLAALLAAVTLVTGWRYVRRVGGITGDFLGATEQVGEIAALAVLAWKG
jgi:adenosylcobinamide-GDP ribazoletransferase